MGKARRTLTVALEPDVRNVLEKLAVIQRRPLGGVIEILIVEKGIELGLIPDPLKEIHSASPTGNPEVAD